MDDLSSKSDDELTQLLLEVEQGSASQLALQAELERRSSDSQAFSGNVDGPYQAIETPSDETQQMSGANVESYDAIQTSGMQQTTANVESDDAQQMSGHATSYEAIDAADGQQMAPNVESYETINADDGTPPLDTGHYDDGHSFGYGGSPPEPTALDAEAERAIEAARQGEPETKQPQAEGRVELPPELRDPATPFADLVAKLKQFEGERAQFEGRTLDGAAAEQKVRLDKVIALIHQRIDTVHGDTPDALQLRLETLQQTEARLVQIIDDGDPLQGSYERDLQEVRDEIGAIRSRLAPAPAPSRADDIYKAADAPLIFDDPSAPPPSRSSDALDVASTDAPGSGRRIVIGGLLAAALVVVVVVAFVATRGGGNDKSTASPTTAAATTAPEPATTAPAAQAPAPAAQQHVLFSQHIQLSQIELCGTTSEKALVTWTYDLQGKASQFAGKTAKLRGKGPGYNGIYRVPVQGTRVTISRHLPCAPTGTHFSMQLLSVGGVPAELRQQ